MTLVTSSRISVKRRLTLVLATGVLGGSLPASLTRWPLLNCLHGAMESGMTTVFSSSSYVMESRQRFQTSGSNKGIPGKLRDLTSFTLCASLVIVKRLQMPTVRRDAIGKVAKLCLHRLTIPQCQATTPTTPTTLDFGSPDHKAISTLMRSIKATTSGPLVKDRAPSTSHQSCTQMTQLRVVKS